MSDRITIRRPDDWHIHLRDGAMLRACLPHTARVFGRGIAMPNLASSVATTADAVAYRERILAALPKGARFTPLMTCYLTHHTDPDDMERGFREGVFTGVKLYPAHATTNSAEGVSDLSKVFHVFERMERIGMPLLMHGEEVDPEIDIFDREAVFIDRRLGPLTRRFPELTMIMEHLTTKVAVDFVRASAPQVGATLTPQHLEYTRNDWIGGGLKPFLYCQPVIKTARDRRALRPRHGFGAASDRPQADLQRRLGRLRRSGGDRELFPNLRRGECAGQARGLRVPERRPPLRAAAERGHHHPGAPPLDGP